MAKGDYKIGVVLDEFKKGTLRSGGSKRPVTNRKQAIAIALSEARKHGSRIPKPNTGGSGDALKRRMTGARGY